MNSPDLENCQHNLPYLYFLLFDNVRNLTNIYNYYHVDHTINNKVKLCSTLNINQLIPKILNSFQMSTQFQIFNFNSGQKRDTNKSNLIKQKKQKEKKNKKFFLKLSLRKHDFSSN